MPGSPEHPVIDWKALFNEGVTYHVWFENSEFEGNCRRMEERFRTLSLPSEIAAFLARLPRRVNVLVFAEAWCGDVVRHVPVLARMEKETERLHVRFVDRHEHPDIFVRFLTNGGESIPRFVFVSENWVECGNWGPMHEAGRRLIARGKAAGQIGAARQKVRALYEEDPGCTAMIAEIRSLLEIASCSEP